MPNQETIVGLMQVLKAAREKKGLTQRALAEKVGMPQSHISKIENGAVDVQTSSLLELARVLDLEVVLAPKALLPALRGLERTTESKFNQEAQQTANKAIAHAVGKARRLADAHMGHDVYPDLLAALQDLRSLQFNTDSVLRLRKLLKQLESALAEVPQDPYLYVVENRDQMLDDSVAYAKLRSRIKELREFRNSVLQEMSSEDMERQPAYRLMDNDDDG